jgi:hypothetical protein
MGSTFVLVSKDDKNMLNMQRNSWHMTGTIQYPMDNGPPLEILKKRRSTGEMQGLFRAHHHSRL